MREACQFASSTDIRPELQDLLSKWILRRPSRVNRQIRLLHPLPNRSILLVSIMWNNKQIRYYSTIYIGHVRVTTVAFANEKKMNDSSIIVKVNEIEQFAVVKEIFSVEENGSFLQVCCLSESRSFNCTTDKTQLSFKNIQQGKLGNDCLVSANDFVEKCVRIDHPSTPLVTFVRFPNLCESS